MGYIKDFRDPDRTRLRTRRVDFRGSQRPDEFVRCGCTRVGAGGRWKSQNRKKVYLSPYVEEPLYSNVIKSFVLELRSRKCFSCFEIPMFYVYMLRTFYIHFAHPYHGYGTGADVEGLRNKYYKVLTTSLFIYLIELSLLVIFLLFKSEFFFKFLKVRRT